LLLDDLVGSVRVLILAGCPVHRVGMVGLPHLLLEVAVLDELPREVLQSA
jgi:hypothetical protein